MLLRGHPSCVRKCHPTHLRCRNNSEGGVNFQPKLGVSFRLDPSDEQSGNTHIYCHATNGVSLAQLMLGHIP